MKQIIISSNLKERRFMDFLFYNSYNINTFSHGKSLNVALRWQMLLKSNQVIRVMNTRIQNQSKFIWNLFYALYDYCDLYFSLIINRQTLWNSNSCIIQYLLPIYEIYCIPSTCKWTDLGNSFDQDYFWDIFFYEFQNSNMMTIQT